MLNHTKAYKISILALFIAFIIIQNYIPLFGYSPVGPLSLTTIQITVIIAGIILGPVDGGIVGGVWGFLSLIKAFTAPSSPFEPLVFTNPLISILPRILVGLFAGYLFILFGHIIKKTSINMIITGLLGALLNTILVLGMIYLFYRTPEVAKAYGASNPAMIGKLLLIVVGTNGIPEAILSAIVTPLIADPILHFVKRDD
ncbi:membrane protein [Philodulcilactobacillus myokoensis]|uniref:Membrane protein n=1 Tax=Philodulcilactobacillus myokoensis TaxID=2929573 RepID=A0A9W6ETZ5_9LACO|nr:ECF transporter S component [Philodulcilactobacillus myokoensis]GLB47513.1 membrane protein [Philodulcilactobacillus myokoensis]